MSESDLKKFADFISSNFTIAPGDPGYPNPNLAPANPSENQILPVPSSNSNVPADLPAPPAKSGTNQNLEIYPPPPDITAAHRAARCQHVKPNGIPCGSPALRDQIYCYFHRIWRTQADRQPFRPDRNGIVWEFPLLEDAGGIQLALQQVLDSVIANKMDLRRANTLLYGLQTAAANVKHVDFDKSWIRDKISTESK